jgi:hypothetical protein
VLHLQTGGVVYLGTRVLSLLKGLLTGLEYSKQKLCKLFIGYRFMAVFHEKYFRVMQVSLRDALRSGIDNIGLQEIIGDAVKRKKPSHAGMFELARTQNRPMIHIGG